MERALVWGLVGSIAYGACQWGALLAIAKIGTPDWVGTFTYGLAVTAPVIMLANMQLNWLQATDGAGRHPFADYWRHRLIFSLAAFGIIVGFSLSLADTAMAALVLLVGGAKVVESWSDVHQGRFQRTHRLDLAARSQILRGVGSVASLGSVAWITGRLWAGVLALGVFWLVVWYGHDRRSGTDGIIVDRSSWSQFRALTRQALPLGVSAMLVSINVSVPRLVIERYAGTHALGIFAALAFVMVGFRLVAVPFGQVFAPRLGESIAAADRARFRQLIGRLVVIGVGLGALGLVMAVGFGPEIIGGLYGPEYAVENRAFVVLMGAAALGYPAIFIQIGVTASRTIGWQILIALLSITVTLGVALMIVPRRPVEGGALAMLAGAVVDLTGALAMLWLAERRFVVRSRQPIVGLP